MEMEVVHEYEVPSLESTDEQLLLNLSNSEGDVESVALESEYSIHDQRAMERHLKNYLLFAFWPRL